MLVNNCATFIASIMTLSVLCFFNSRDNKHKIENKNNSNYVQGLLESIIERASFFFSRNENKVLQNIKKKYEEVVNIEAIKKLFESKSDISKLTIINNIQNKISEYQNVYFTCKKSILYVKDKITQRDEFLSSFFYTFLFSFFVLCIDCFDIDGLDILWLKNVVFYASATSIIFLVSMWLFYFLSIKRVRIAKEPIAYEFRYYNTIIILVLINIVLAFVSNLLVKSEVSLHVIYALSIIFPLLHMYYKLMKRRRSVFTHYFILVHFIIILLHSFIFSAIQYLIVGNTFIIQNKIISICSVIAISIGGLVFPFFIPLIRMIYEVELSNYKLKKAEFNLNNSVEDIMCESDMS